MASITDIPDTLRHVERAPDFVAWLIQQPITFDVRRALAHLWEQHTDATLLNADWIRISNAAEPNRGS